MRPGWLADQFSGEYGERQRNTGALAP
jgi:hypothetical protein